MQTPSRSTVHCCSEGVSWGPLRIYVFPCGHGDTIVLELPDGRWALVDCCLAKSNGTWDAFLAFAENKKIDHFAIIILSHPHFDHFRGMSDLLRHFSVNGKVTYFLDGGMCATEVVAYYHVGQRSLRRLHDAVKDLSKQGKVKYRPIGTDIWPASLAACPDVFSFVPLAPDQQEQREEVRDALMALPAGGTFKADANDSSVVVAIRVGRGGGAQCALLTADAEDGLDLALKNWVDYCSTKEWDCSFSMLKIPHHGSSSSQSKRLPEMRRQDGKATYAAVSSSLEPKYSGIPDRRVLERYLEAGWTVLSTAPRRESRVRRPNRAFEVSGTTRSMLPQESEHIICVTLDGSGARAFEPHASQVVIEDIMSYGTASEVGK